MNNDPMNDGLESCTLSNLLAGALEEQFQERLHEAGEVSADHRRLVTNKAGMLSMEIPVKIVLVYDPVDRIWTAGGVVGQLKKPAPRGFERPIYRRPDGFKVRTEVQGELLTEGNVTGITAAAGKQDEG